MTINSRAMTIFIFLSVLIVPLFVAGDSIQYIGYPVLIGDPPCRNHDPSPLCKPLPANPYARNDPRPVRKSLSYTRVVNADTPSLSVTNTYPPE